VGVRRDSGSPLLGRTTEWNVALAAMEDGRSGVVFAGPPGVGRTSLARALVDELSRRAESEVLWILGAASGAIPFGAFAPLLPEIGGRPGPQDGLHLLQSFRAAIVRRAHERPLILAIDDGDRLDPESATLVFQLVVTAGARLVMTERTGRPGPHPLQTLWKEGLVARIDVAPLDHGATVQMIGRLLSRDGQPEALVGGELGEAVWRASAGHPLYIRELTRGAIQAGVIGAHDGVWRLEGGLEPGPRLTELLVGELDELDEAGRDTLRLVAMAAPLPLRVLTRLAPVDAVDHLQERGFISFSRLGGDAIAEVRHPLLAVAVRASVPAATAAQLGCRLADAFVADGREERDLVRIVTWRLDGGADPCALSLSRAATAASLDQRWALAERLAEAAVASGAGFEGRLVLADARRAQGLYDTALTALGAGAGADGDQTSRAAVLRAAILFSGIGKPEEALAGLTEAAPLVSSASDRAWLAAVAAGLQGFLGRPDVAVARGWELLAQPHLAPRAEATVRAVLSLGLSWTGRSETALEVIDALPATALRGLAISPWYFSARALACFQSGRVGEMEDFCREHYEAAVAVNDMEGQGNAAVGLGVVALQRAELARAVSWFRDATLALPSAEGQALRIQALLSLAEALAISGEPEAARSALEEAGPATRRSPLLESGWAISAAWVAAAEGALSEALEGLAGAAIGARQTYQVALESTALHAMVRLGSGAPRLRLKELAVRVESPVVALMAAHAAALAAAPDGGDDGAALDTVAERYANSGQFLYAVEAAAQACRAHQRAGHRRKAAASAARGSILLRHAGPPPLGLALAMAPAELTRREREVALLAATGLPSQAIAGRLCLSVRTVETHLARVYVKLGIGGRTELAGALDAATTSWGGVA
jgi:DNA-binding CsgD family transcriptional regulator